MSGSTSATSSGRTTRRAGDLDGVERVDVLPFHKLGAHTRP
ncbi:hypothetical protein ACWDSD_01980 [Streptomyces spiralis]